MKSLAVVLLSVSLVQGQTEISPTLSWQANFGGRAADVPATIRTVSDGFVLGASSYSTDEVRTAPHFGSRDFWVIRLNPNGAKMWDRSYGGSSVDSLTDLAVDQAGLLLGGTSSSGPAIKKTALLHGANDFWIVRTGPDGQQQWDTSFGGSEADELQVVRRCPNGGWILGGYSSSPVSGNKQAPHYGAEDFWVIRINDQGKKIWEKTFGGSGADQLHALEPIAGGHFIVGGSSDSPADGNKTTAPSGSGDFWALRLDPDGNIVWQKSYGGPGFERIQAIVPTSAGNVLLGGYTDSTTGNRISTGGGELDFWVMEIRPDGEMLWENSYGGDAGDVLLSAQATPDGGFFLGGYSFSTPSGNKKAPLFGSADLWIVRIDDAGKILYDAGYGGSDQEITFAGTFAPGGGYTFCGYSTSEPSGNKIAPNNGNSDIWMARLAPEKPQLILEKQATSDAANALVLNLVPGDSQQAVILEATQNLSDWTPVYTNKSGAAETFVVDEVASRGGTFFRVTQ